MTGTAPTPRGAGVAERLDRRGLFRDGQPISDADLAGLLNGRRQDPDPAGVWPARARSRSAEPPLSLMQRLEHIFCLAPLWELSERIEADIAAEAGPSPAGRKRRWPIMLALAMDVALWENGSIRAAVRELADPVTWRRLRRRVKRAWPGRPGQRLPKRPISRSQYHRARQSHTLPRLPEIKAWAEKTSAETARWIEMLDPKARAFTHPQTGNIVIGDGTWMNPLWGGDPRNPGIRANPHTGEITPRRCDPDAVQHSKGFGLQAVFASVRNPHPGERVILAAEIKPPHGSDANAFTDTVPRLAKEHQIIRDGLAAVVYDRGLQAPDINKLLDAGIIPVAKPLRTSTGAVPTAILRGLEATLAGGTRRAVTVTAIDGTPTIARTDHQGTLHHLPLTRTQTRIRRNKTRPAAVYTHWRIPRHPLAGNLQGATLTIRHNPPAEHEKDDTPLRINRALRPIPASDADYDRIYGIREDVESTNNHLKERLRHDRAHTIGRDRQQLNLIGYQINTAITALVHWHKRTGGDITPWFGQPPP